MKTFVDGEAQRPSKFVPTSPAAIASQQDVLDTFVEAGILQVQVRHRRLLDRRTFDAGSDEDRGRVRCRLTRTGRHPGDRAAAPGRMRPPRSAARTVPTTTIVGQAQRHPPAQAAPRGPIKAISPLLLLLLWYVASERGGCPRTPWPRRRTSSRRPAS